MGKDEDDFKNSYGNNKEIGNGPIDKRSCTDIPCCLLFILSILAMIAIAASGFSKGTPVRLTYPYDSDGKSCGEDYPDKPYIYFTVPYYNSAGVLDKTTMKYLNKTICV